MNNGKAIVRNIRRSATCQMGTCLRHRNISNLCSLCADASKWRNSGMSFDSFRYLAGVNSILSSGAYLDISGAPQSIWPPGTSILYAAGASLSGTPPEELVKFVNLAALLLMAGSIWLIIEITIERWWIAVITFASILLNTAILSWQNKLWSDPLAPAASSAAIASGIVACRGSKNWFGWICVASARRQNDVRASPNMMDHSLH